MASRALDPAEKTPMHRSRAGFTLIELLIVVTIIGLLAAAFLPDLLSSRTVAYIAADSANMQQQYKWIELYSGRTKVGHMPTEGGHKFLLDLWVKKVIDPTEENFDRFFTPGLREQDPHYIELRKKVQLREPIWTDLGSVTSLDTHYAARAKNDIMGMTKANEAWVANDNEFDWAFNDGTINVLYGASVRTLSLQMLMEQYQWPGLEEVFKTYGPDSPHPDLKKLDK
jgi:prepilin-type N-terminal cleavage/methylation domain-containing protein